ncbi:MAG: nucleotide exchange factor GrpE [Eubacterium sp.]
MEKEKETLDENLTEEVETNMDTEESSNTENDATETSEKQNDDEAVEEPAEEGTEEKTEPERKKKKVFKKKDKKDQQIEELNDKYQRLFAEFQNYRSRSEKEKSSMYEIGAKAIIEKILPVVDNLERGVAALSEEDLGSPVGEGMNLIYKQMITALEEMGVTVIETEGKEFDPELHNAVMHEDNEELGENMISQEFQKGYKYRDSVIRHSMVKVAN